MKTHSAHTSWAFLQHRELLSDSEGRPWMLSYSKFFCYHGAELFWANNRGRSCMESLHWHSGLNLFLHSQKSPALQGLKDGASLAEPSWMCRTCGESRAASPELCRVAFATAGPKVNTGMGTSAQLRAHNHWEKWLGGSTEQKEKLF